MMTTKNYIYKLLYLPAKYHFRPLATYNARKIRSFFNKFNMPRKTEDSPTATVFSRPIFLLNNRPFPHPY
jgi:hypothetical protein